MAKERLSVVNGHIVRATSLYQETPCGSGLIRSPFPDVTIPSDVTIFQSVFHNLDIHAHNTAVVDAISGRLYTYLELSLAVKKFGSALMRKGFKKGDVFAICIPNSPEFAIFFLAVIGLGGTVTPINPQYTVREIRNQLCDSDAKWIISVVELEKKIYDATLGVAGIKHIILMGRNSSKKSLAAEDLLQDNGSCFPKYVPIDVQNDVAILPYSSGTTGKPKGVMLTHYSIVANLHQTKVQWPFRPGDRYVCFVPMYHAYGIYLMLGALSNGSSVYYLPKFLPDTFLGTIQKYKITHAHLVPPVIIFLVKSPLVENYDLSSFQTAYSGSAPLAKEISDAFVRKFSHLKTFQQGYGMTETSPVVCATPEWEILPSTVGYIVPNSEAKVVDLKTGAALGPNKEGEIYVRGPHIMKGYLNNPTATAEAIDSEGFFHTGDTGYYDEEGHFFIVDRVKELIKYNAYQVAPAELEALLLSHPDVADAAVIGIPNERAGELPKAYIVKKNVGLTGQKIHNFIKENAAPFKWLRGGVEFMPEIPKSASGKILRKNLRDRAKNINAKL